MGIFLYSIDIYKEMKNLIRKILKESEDEFEWAKGLDVDAAEKEIYKPFKDIAYEWDVDARAIYDTLIEFGVRQPSQLKEIGELLYGEFDGVYDRGKDVGYDHGRDDCTCDGCCDEYVYYDDHRQQVDDAENEGYERGYETGVSDAKGESEDRIQELEGQIQELQSTIEELRSRSEG